MHGSGFSLEEGRIARGGEDSAQHGHEAGTREKTRNKLLYSPRCACPITHRREPEVLERQRME